MGEYGVQQAAAGARLALGVQPERHGHAPRRAAGAARGIAGSDGGNPTLNRLKLAAICMTDCMAVFVVGCLLLALPGSARAQSADLAPAEFAPADFPPFNGGERLVYRLLWPSGIPLGEAVFEVSRDGDDLHFEATLEARLPQYRFNSTFSAVASRKGLCSRQFHQKIEEGKQTSEESMEFDQEAHKVQRIQGRNTTSATIPECARDPLTFLYYLRSQAAAGQSVASGRIHYGKEIALQLHQDGTGTVVVGGVEKQGEKFEVRFPARNGEQTVEVWFSSDPARTPFQFTVPTTLADFKAELE